MATFDPMLLLQRQMEVSGVLRNPPRNEDELIAAKDCLASLVAFITKIGRLATKLQLPLELVFQCLMQIGVGGPIDFDKQKRDGNVPMHQAKVLNREAATNIEPQVRQAVDPETLNEYTRLSQILRTFLRMKVEDGNDLSMARKAIVIADDYMNQIASFAQGNPTVMWNMYLADDEGKLRAALGLEAGGSAGDNDQGGKPLPRNWVAACVQESAPLKTLTAPVPARQGALATVDSWLQQVPPEELSAEFVALLKGIHSPLAVQLGEKRSALTRAAANIITFLLLRADPNHLATYEVREAISGWAEVLLKQVHVTVATIANASDSLMRDIVVATHGASYVFTSVFHALSKATQPELQRKCLNYLALGLVVTNNDKAAKCHHSAPYVRKLITSSSEPVRKVARVFGILALQCAPDTPVGFDEKVQKTAMAESAQVLQMASKGPATFECGILKYSEPCSVSANPDWSPTSVATTPAHWDDFSSSASPVHPATVSSASNPPRRSSTGGFTSSMSSSGSNPSSRQNSTSLHQQQQQQPGHHLHQQPQHYSHQPQPSRQPEPHRQNHHQQQHHSHQPQPEVLPSRPVNTAHTSSHTTTTPHPPARYSHDGRSPIDQQQPFSPDCGERVVPISLLSTGNIRTPPTGNFSGSLKQRLSSGNSQRGGSNRR